MFVSVLPKTVPLSKLCVALSPITLFPVILLARSPDRLPLPDHPWSLLITTLHLARSLKIPRSTLPDHPWSHSLITCWSHALPLARSLKPPCSSVPDHPPPSSICTRTPCTCTTIPATLDHRRPPPHVAHHHQITSKSSDPIISVCTVILLCSSFSFEWVSWRKPATAPSSFIRTPSNSCHAKSASSGVDPP